MVLVDTLLDSCISSTAVWILDFAAYVFSVIECDSQGTAACYELFYIIFFIINLVRMHILHMFLL
jgi:hypothetical protein